MRLIDAEKYPCKTCGISYCHENCEMFYKWLNGCDYDVEKVVAELEDKSAMDIFDKAWYVRKNEAIRVVRKGGVE